MCIRDSLHSSCYESHVNYTANEQKEEFSRAKQKAKEYRELHTETEETFASLKKAKEDLEQERSRRERVSFDKS
eukprot:12938480-Prorocentrum_lima.AAC.1